MCSNSSMLYLTLCVSGRTKRLPRYSGSVHKPLKKKGFCSANCNLGPGHREQEFLKQVIRPKGLLQAPCALGSPWDQEKMLLRP